jgi:hypothetical protein
VVLEADWVIDATGRKQVLAKQLGLRRMEREAQRDCFWFRLKDFDRRILGEIEALGPMPPGVGEPYHYDRYFSTHHFMGKGNWIWLIPLRSEGDGDLMSIGLSTRPDVYPHTVRTVEGFLEHVASEHPVITELVESGTIVDTNLYRNYRYVVDQAYSEDRWCIIGDAAFAADPLFSNGLTFSSIQIEQVGEMIDRDRRGDHDADYIRRLESVFWAPLVGSQNTIAEWYETMDDPLLCAARLHYIEVSYFYLLLPLITNRCHLEPDRLAEWRVMLLKAGAPLRLPQALVDARTTVGEVAPAHFVYQGKEKVNRAALRQYEDLAEMRARMQKGADLLREYVDQLLDRWSTPAPETSLDSRV